jgi:hypothetical protein
MTTLESGKTINQASLPTLTYSTLNAKPLVSQSCDFKRFKDKGPRPGTAMTRSTVSFKDITPELSAQIVRHHILPMFDSKKSTKRHG